MFGFLKDKLKSWLGKAKEKISEKEPKEEKVEKKAKPAAAKKEERKEKAKEKQKKRERTKEELKEERDITEKVRVDIEKEKLEIKTPEEKTEELIKELEAKKEEVEEKEIEEEQKPKEKKPGFFERLKKVFTYQITESDFNSIFEDLEFSLLENNVALEVVEKIKSSIKEQLINKEIKKNELEEEITKALKQAISEILIDPEDIVKQIKEFKKENKEEPFKILFFGINGAGKTTSIAKVCHLLQKSKFSVILAAGDTFRAASIEQLQIHADKLKVKMIKHDYGSDPSSVAFDAIKYAKSNNIDVVLIDTAGRMHTRDNLLKEMEKICRVTKPNLKVFVAEAISGNDATEQARAFNEIAGIDGSILSKTDVDEKGGTVLSVSYITHKPIFYLGVGQNYEDLKLFNKDEFIKQLGL